MAIGINKVIEVLLKSAEIITASKDQLEQLDSSSGDGDLGISMKRGADAIKAVLSVSGAENDIGNLLIKCAMAFNKEAPSTLGTLLSSAMLAAGKETKGRSELSEGDVVKLVEIMTKSIMDRGKAALGDKTILDAMIPMSEAMRSSFEQGKSLAESVKAGAAAAAAGAEATKELVAKAGRAKWIGERTNGFLDGGAVLCSIVINHLAKV